MPFESGPQFLKEKYGLHTKPEVEAAVERSEEQIPDDPNMRIQAYLDRLENVFDPPELEGHEQFDRKDRNLTLIKSSLHKNFVIRPEGIPEGYWDTQRRIARERGHGDIEVSQEMREQGAEIIIADQESSLDNWVDYLASDDATYPLWLKYFAMRGILGMSTYNKEKHQFNKRDKGTVAPFPDLDREALAYVLDAVEKRQGPEYAELSVRIRQEKNALKRLKGDLRMAENQGADTAELETFKGEQEEKVRLLEKEQASVVSGSLEVPDEARTELSGLLKEADFASLYAWAAEKIAPAEENELMVTDGQWVKYDQGSDHTPLVESLKGYGTGWCTAGESTAKSQLYTGDFYVYYSNDRQDNPTIPRVAIRMEEDMIAEVRGVANEQNLDPYIGKVVQEKMLEFPDGEYYEKKALSMRKLTLVENKAKNGWELDRDDLLFLYEIDEEIEGFGYERDPRIDEIKNKRNPIFDASIIIECSLEEIARNSLEINEETKAYIGPLESGIFDTLNNADIEHIYTDFPKRRIELSKIEIGGNSVESLKQELSQKNINIYPLADMMLNSSEFTISSNTESLDLVSLNVSDLGLDEPSTSTDHIYSMAAKLGLELCPGEVGPAMRLNNADLPLNDHYFIAMNDIQVSTRSIPCIYSIGCDSGGQYLAEGRANNRRGWGPDARFVFQLRKLSQES